jgi:glycosyltransferase involved in cell wall biosynthesis
MKNVTFITTGQPTTNPRLVKEAEILHSLGYRVKVICCFYQQWAQKSDQTITAKFPEMYIYCGGDPVEKKAVYLKTRIRQKISFLLFKYTNRFGVPENAISRTHAEALTIAKKIKTDLYIAHNLGALPAAVCAAKYTGCKVGYDAEDMHSGQFLSADDPNYQLNSYIEKRYFKQTDYFTAASPLIAKYYKREYSYLRPIVINNVFPKIMQKIRRNNKGGDPLRLFWFSQTVGPDRGLEDVLKAMATANGYAQLHLLGSCADDYKLKLLNLTLEIGLSADQLCLHDPVDADEIFDYTSRFDIGMATETGLTLNRDICLTNKIFTYIQCGLSMIVSDTKAQKLFLRQYPFVGRLYQRGDLRSLTACIDFYLENPDILSETRKRNYHLGQTKLNWESESKIFVNLVQNTIVE